MLAGGESVAGVADDGAAPVVVDADSDPFFEGYGSGE